MQVSRRKAIAGVAAVSVALPVSAIAGPGDTADPIYPLIEECRRAYEAVRAEMERCDRLRASIPAELRDWPGVFLGVVHGSHGDAACFCTDEATIADRFRHALAQSRTEAERAHVIAARDAALAEVRTMTARRDAAWKATGIDESPLDDLERVMAETDYAVRRAVPTTLAGFVAKVKYLAEESGGCEQSIEHAEMLYGPTEPNSVLAYLRRDVAALVGSAQP